MRTAHIVTATHEVGDRVLALCGKDHKVKQLWEDIPEEAPICRDCVDLAVLALDEADGVVMAARRYWRRTTYALTALGETLAPDDLALDVIADANDLFQRAQATKKQDKADQRKAKRTCTCEWRNIDDKYTDPDCPIHGHDDELPPVAPPVE